MIFLDSEELPDGWVQTTLGEVGHWSSGGTPSRKESNYYGGNIPWVKTGNLSDEIIQEIDENITEEGLKNSSAKIFPRGSLIVAMYGATIGKLGILKDSAATNQACAALLSKGITKEVIQFVFYYLLNSREALRKIAKGGAQPNISQTVIKEFPCPFPPINEQRRIVTKIEELTAHSRRAREALDDVPTLINQFRQSVLAAAFRGDLTADWREKNPDVEPAEKLLERIRTKSSSRMPQINERLPDSWAWVRFSDVAEIQSNLVDPYDHHDAPHVAPNHIESNTARLLPFKTIKEDGVTSPKHLFYSGQIIYSKIRPYLAKASLVDFSGLCSADMYPVTAKINSKFLLFWMVSTEFTKLASEKQGRTVLPKINQKALNQLPVPVPSLKEQEAIVKLIDASLSVVKKQSSFSESVVSEIKDLEQSILAKAFRGELVSQDPTDEPASVLLERIRVEREKLGSTKKKKRSPRKKAT